MTETVADYVTRTTVRLQPKRCPGCMSVFGQLVADGEQLLVGQVLMTRFWGTCARCCGEIIWNKADRHIESITREAKARKAK